jgi:hypothetical protein
MGAFALQRPAPSLFFEDKLVPSSSEIAPGSRPNSVKLKVSFRAFNLLNLKTSTHATCAGARV